MKDILSKLTNTKIVISVVSLVLLILTTWGIKIPQHEIEVTVQALCTIGVLLGIMNDEGMRTRSWNDVSTSVVRIEEEDPRR